MRFLPSITLVLVSLVLAQGKVVPKYQYGAILRHVADPKIRYNIHQAHYDDPLPTNFDARDHWPDCPAIKQISDQGMCGSCWAVSSADAIRDRICIASKGKQQPTVAVLELLQCVISDITQDDNNHTVVQKRNGICDGGEPLDALKQYVDYGLPTGSDVDGSGCKPYVDYLRQKFECEHRCLNPSYTVAYKKDLHFGEGARQLDSSKPQDVVKEIQWEILKNGPVVAGFDVYGSFDGAGWDIYRHSPGEPKPKDGHAVRVVGWGTENGTDYWIYLNSWGEGFGKRGAGRFLRGTNECEFESFVTAGTPKV